MKKSKNIILVVVCILLLAVTVVALMTGGEIVDNSANVSKSTGILEEALGVINQSFPTLKP
ncbi:MAG: hypothetical protein MRZ79_03590 [Bacteroidia bacterium]|nr:hypothetical protein [Bacteroidia bacterium]